MISSEELNRKVNDMEDAIMEFVCKNPGTNLHEMLSKASPTDVLRTANVLVAKGKLCMRHSGMMARYYTFEYKGEDWDVLRVIKQNPGHTLSGFSDNFMKRVKRLVECGELCVRYSATECRYYATDAPNCTGISLSTHLHEDGTSALQNTIENLKAGAKVDRELIQTLQKNIPFWMCKIGNLEDTIQQKNSRIGELEVAAKVDKDMWKKTVADRDEKISSMNAALCRTLQVAERDGLLIRDDVLRELYSGRDRGVFTDAD